MRGSAERALTVTSVLCCTRGGQRRGAARALRVSGQEAPRLRGRPAGAGGPAAPELGPPVPALRGELAARLARARIETLRQTSAHF